MGLRWKGLRSCSAQNGAGVVHTLQPGTRPACRIVGLPTSQVRTESTQASAAQSVGDQSCRIISVKYIDQTKEPVADDQDMVNVACGEFYMLHSMQPWQRRVNDLIATRLVHCSLEVLPQPAAKERPRVILTAHACAKAHNLGDGRVLQAFNSRAAEYRCLALSRCPRGILASPPFWTISHFR